jgi:hypothetical protein
VGGFSSGRPVVRDASKVDDDAESTNGGGGMILQHPRLAWDGARVIVRALDSEYLYGWLDERLGDLLGPAYQQALSDSWNRLWWTERVDAPQAEAGLWRARLGDLLQTHPELAGPLQDLIYEAVARLSEPPAA